MVGKTKISFISLMCVSWILSVSIANAGPTSPTPWKVVDKSMGQLLSSGWKIVGHTGYRVVVLPATVSAFDETTFSYILYKDGKYINCLIYSPRPDNAHSGCRQLNE